MKGTKIRNRIFALILALVMVVSIVTVSASAATAENNDTTTEQKYTTKLDDPVDIYESVIIENDGTGEITEVVSLRQENAKHFKMPDGTFQAVYYATPVHRKDTSGAWQDIDNSLTLKTDSALFSTSDNRMSFAKSFQPNESLFTLNENGYSVSMTLIENTLSSGALATMSATNAVTLTPQATVTNAPQRQTRWETIDDAVAINNSGSIKYTSIRKNTDLEYVLVGNDVKENIIVNAPLESYVYNFRLDIPGLQATLEENGNVSLKDIETGKTKYRIPAPYMFDANGVISYAVSYGLVELPNGSYVLTVTADTEWINDSARTFPVTIDPTLHPVSDSYDTFVYSGEPTTNYGTETEMYINSNTQAYVYIDLYDLPVGARMQSAKLHAYYYLSFGSTGQSITLNTYQIMSSWDETSVTWNTKPTLGNAPLSSKTLSYSTTATINSPALTDFYITSAVEEWLDGTSENYGIALIASPGSNLIAHLKTYEFDTEYMPSISIQYEYFFEGVFGIENALWANNYVTATSTNVNFGTEMGVSYIRNSVFPDEFRPRSLFKIINVRETEQYIIRSMYDNTLILSVVDGKLKLKRVYLQNDDIPNTDTFIIQWDGRGYQIMPYGTTDLLYLSGTDQIVTTTPQSEVTSAARWNFTRYDDTVYGKDIPSVPQTVMAGTTLNLSPRFWSTNLEENLPYMYLTGAGDYIATAAWDGVASTFEVNFFNPGEVTIVLAIMGGTSGYFYTWSYEVKILLESGEYYFLNKQTDKLLQLDTDNSFFASGTVLRQGSFAAESHQKFIVYHRGEGYYSIISAASNMAVTTTTAIYGSTVTQEIYHGSVGQMWSFLTLPEGDVIIKSKVNEVSVLFLNAVASREPFTYDNLHKYANWHLMSTALVDATLIGVPDASHINNPNHTQYFADIIGWLSAIGYSDVRLFGEVTLSEFLIYMTTSRIFLFRGHGSSDSIALNEEQTLALNVSDIAVLAPNSLNNCKLMALVSCSTGSGYEDSPNLMNAIYRRGAISVVGFAEVVYCMPVTNWQRKFFYAMCQGANVQVACRYATQDTGININSIYIAGSKVQTII